MHLAQLRSGAPAAASNTRAQLARRSVHRCIMRSGRQRRTQVARTARTPQHAQSAVTIFSQVPQARSDRLLQRVQRRETFRNVYTRTGCVQSVYRDMNAGGATSIGLPCTEGHSVCGGA